MKAFLEISFMNCRSRAGPSMLRINNILGSIFFLCFYLTTTINLLYQHYHTHKQRIIRIEPRIKLPKHQHFLTCICLFN